MLTRWGFWIIALATSEAVADPIAAPPESRPVVRIALERAADLAPCITESAVREAVTNRLGRDPFRADAVDRLHVTLTLSRDREEPDPPLHVRIEREGPTGSRGMRELDAPAGDCPGLLDTLSLSIAIAVDPLGYAGGSDPTLSPAPAGAPRSPAIRVSGLFGAGVVGTLGAEPEASVGMIVQLGARRGAMSLAVEGRADLSRTRSIATGQIEVSSMIASAVGCVAVWVPRLCAVAGATRLRGVGHGFAVTRTDASWAPLVGGRIAWPLHIGAVQVVPSVDVLVSPIRTTFEVDAATVWTTPWVQAAVGVAVALTFF